MPAFSVVICTYNRASLVPRAIDSVLDQSFRDFELIVVDDGSVDDTKAVVSAIDDDRVRYVYRDNGGLSAARNTGVEHGAGGSIVFLDDDDEALPDWLGELDAGRGGDDDAVVTCGELAVDEDGRVVGTRLPEALGAAFEGYRWLFVAGTFAVPRHAYHAAGGFAEGLQCSHQTEFALRLLPLCRARGWPVHVVDKPLIRRLLREPEARRTPARVVSGATFVLERHQEQLARSPRFLGNWYATAGVAAARTGDYRNARRFLARASRTDPRNWKHHARLALALAPPLGDRVWRVRRYRAPAGEPARTG